MKRNDKKEVEALLAASEKEPLKILFVCLGNICRSPAAQGIMEAKLKEKDLSHQVKLDSAGLYGGHRGELPDRRMRVHANQRGYNLTHRSRPVNSSDFSDFDIIIGMDNNNYDRLRNLAPTPEEEKKVVRMIDLIDGFSDFDYIPDPYYEGSDGFELVLDMLEEGTDKLIELILSNKKESNK